MAPEAGGGLFLTVLDRIGPGMNRVAGGAVDVLPVVGAAVKTDGLAHLPDDPVALHAGGQLLLARRLVLAAAEVRQRRESPAPVRPGYVDAAGPVAGFAVVMHCRRAGILQVEMRAGLDCAHLAAAVAAQARFGTFLAIFAIRIRTKPGRRIGRQSMVAPTCETGTRALPAR